MSFFDTLIVQPIFNLLMAIYGIIPGSDFGIALIIFTVLVRLIMWPLVKKQLHQTKIQRQIQPELKKIKAKANGDKQLEGQLMLELYRTKGVNPLGSIGLLFIQLPIFIALYQVVNIISTQKDKIGVFTYDVLEKLGPIHTIVTDPKNLNETLLGLVNLGKHAFENGTIYWPVMVIAVVASILQYIQSKQVMPKIEKGKKLRDIMAASANGQQPDATEMSTAMSNGMVKFFPIMTFMFLIYVPGALGLYYLVSSLVAIIQQHLVLSRDVEEMEELADSAEVLPEIGASKQTSVRVIKAQEATVVNPSAKKKHKRR